MSLHPSYGLDSIHYNFIDCHGPSVNASRLACGRSGVALMYVVNNSSRALLVALIPLAAVHAVLTAMALLGNQAAQPADVPSPDQVFVLYVARLATDGALLFAGERVLRQRVA